jgi:hypothetical protein
MNAIRSYLRRNLNAKRLSRIIANDKQCAMFARFIRGAKQC